MSIHSLTLRPNNNFSHWEKIPDLELIELFQRVQQVYEQSLAKSYLITFGPTPSEGLQITAYGTRLKGESLPQMNQEGCSFCEMSKENFKNDSLIEKSSDFFKLRSLNHQILIIPNSHHSHWFETPLNTQLELLRNTFRLRQNNPSLIKKNIELHCGSLAGQTVPHLHVRTGIYLNH